MKVWMAGIPVLCGILLLGVCLEDAYAQEKEKIGSEPFAEFCVSFKAEPECSICNTCGETDNKHYAFHLLKKIDIPQDSEWEYPDSLDNCGHIYWKYYFRMDVVDKGLLFDDNESGNGEEYGYRGDYSKFSCEDCTEEAKRKKSADPPLLLHVDTISLTRYFWEDYRDSLKVYYGKTFKIEWNALLSCGCPHYTVKRISHTFDARLVGECKQERE